MTCSNLRSTLLLAAAALAMAAPARAQDERRLDRIDKQVKELRAIVFQGRDTGQPVVVKPEGPDPQVTALEQRVGDLEQTLQKVNGGLDSLSHDVDEAKRAQATTTQTSADQLKGLIGRVAKLEAQAAAAPVAAPTPADAGAGAGASAPPSRRGRGAASSDATAAAQADDSGRLGGPAASQPVRASEADAYKAAKAQLASGDYPGAASAFQDYLARYPSGPRIPEAHYWRGEALFIQDTYPDAARDYALALKGWPKTGWAPEATVKLAQSLLQMNRPQDACAAAAEFGRRYGASASSGLKVRADALRAKAKCAA